MCSRLVYPAARAALARGRREERLDAAELRHGRTLLEWLWTQARIVDADAALARRAGELAERHALGAEAGVHLATALAVADPRVVVTTWDRPLALAALAEGRPVATAPGRRR